MTLRNGEVVSEEEDDDDDLSDLLALEDAFDVEDELAPQRPIYTLVTRRSLNMQAKEEEVQHENFFYTRCMIHDKLCSMIIDGGSYANIINATLVDKLGFKITKHPKPYRL